MGNSHPKGLYNLFFTEMWERFSFYGMRALLILYMTRQMLYGDTAAYGIYAAYTALVYATPFIGGVIADQILGYRKSIYLGGALMAIGLFLMTVSSEFFFYSGLSFIIIGNGFFKPNISSMVGKLYKPGDPRRDGGFTIFYMGINLGAFFSPLTCGLLGELLGWHYGFGLAGIGMIVGLIVFSSAQKYFAADNGTPPNPVSLKKPLFAGLSQEILIYLGTFLSIPLIGLLLWHYDMMNYFLTPFVVIVFAGIIYMSIRMSKIERERIWVILILAFFTIIFWAFFEQAGSSITLFTDLNVNRNIFGFTIPTSVYQSVNPLFIILLAPIFSSLWLALSKRNREPNTAVKFAMGLFNLGLGFGVFVLGASLAGDDGKVSMLFLFLGYMLHTMGELCLSPVGLSMVTRLAPARLVAMIMGAWFLSTAMAQYLGGTIAKLTSTEQFMETGLSYEAKAGFKGRDEVLLRSYFVNEGDTLFSKPLKVNIDVTKAVEEAEFIKPDVFNIYRAVKPGEAVDVNLRVPYLDPTGDLTTINFDPKAKYGTITVTGDTVRYQASVPDSAMALPMVDTLQYEVFETDVPTRHHNVALIVTVDDHRVLQPTLARAEMNVKVPMATAIKKSKSTINVLNNFLMPGGEKVNLQVVKEAKAGYIGFGNVLNTFVGPSKTIHIYSKVFYYLFLVAIGVGFVVLLISPILKKWMHGEH
jgi:POT family proton-dependent oligopeptide transporter